MKMLDEVIKAYEICTKEQPCSLCPYMESDANGKWACALCGDCTFDALYYLKEYREKKQEIADISIDYVVLKQWWAEQQENPPLTWDELKTMLGQPVWLVYDWNNIHYKGWILLDQLKGIFIIDAKDEWALSEANIDNWKAYRKEQK